MNRGLSGLVNQGNSCYLNSMVQVLAHLPYFSEYFLHWEHEILKQLGERAAGSLTYQFLRLVQALWENNTTVLPASFRKVFYQKFTKVTPGPHDAEEALTNILGMLQEELCRRQEIPVVGTLPQDPIVQNAFYTMKSYYERNYCVITELFNGFLDSSICCPECGHQVHHFEPFTIIPLSIPDMASTLFECLTAFFTEEKLDPKNFWKCEKCSRSVPAVKLMRLLSRPVILILQFKRFRNDGQKDQRQITYPETLNMDTFLSTIRRDKKEYIYHLYAVVNHVGTPQSGHYYTVTRVGAITSCTGTNPSDAAGLASITDGINKMTLSGAVTGTSPAWYLFDDQRVHAVSTPASPYAYLLFYVRNIDKFDV